MTNLSIPKEAPYTEGIKPSAPNLEKDKRASLKALKEYINITAGRRECHSSDGSAQYKEKTRDPLADLVYWKVKKDPTPAME